LVETLRSIIPVGDQTIVVDSDYGIINLSQRASLKLNPVFGDLSLCDINTGSNVTEKLTAFRKPRNSCIE
jgi:hypothetical protein